MTSEKEIPKDYIEAMAERGFEIEEKIGTGGTGSVYRANQKTLQRPVAIKFLDNPYTRASDKARKRFDREAYLLAAAQHPSIPFV